MIVLDVITVIGKPVLSMRLVGRMPEPGDIVRKHGEPDGWRVLGVDLHQGEPLGLLVERECPYVAGDDVEVFDAKEAT